MFLQLINERIIYFSTLKHIFSYIDNNINTNQDKTHSLNLNILIANFINYKYLYMSKLLTHEKTILYRYATMCIV